MIFDFVSLEQAAPWTVRERGKFIHLDWKLIEIGWGGGGKTSFAIDFSFFVFLSFLLFN